MSDEIYANLEQSEQALRDSTAKLDQLRGLRESMSGLTGHAEGADGLVRVEVGGAGVSELVIEPKAMRLPAEDLAAAIKQAIADANEDMRGQAAQAMRESGLLGDPADRAAAAQAARERLAEASEQFGSSMRSAVHQIDEARSRFGSGR